MGPMRRVMALAGLILCAAGCTIAERTVGGVETEAAATDTGDRTSGSAGLRGGSDALATARALRREGRIAQALAILESEAVRAPENAAVLAAYGKLLVEAGQPEQAAEVLARSHTPDSPDWRILSAQGVAADQMGDHAQARALYAAALRVRPDEPGVLTNLGLSYALARQLGRAEETLRRASAQPGAAAATRQALALVLALAGKTAEARSVASRDLSAADASRSVALLGQFAPGR
jgi:Flp pilus assembly protein TadD